MSILKDGGETSTITLKIQYVWRDGFQMLTLKVEGISQSLFKTLKDRS